MAIQRNGEDRAFLPFEDMAPGLPFLPDLGRTAALDDEAKLLVKMPLGVESARAGQLDDIHAPQAFGAEELHETSPSAEPLPVRQGQVLHAPNPDVAINRHALTGHEAVIRKHRPLECAQPRILARLRLVPMRGRYCVVHGTPPSMSIVRRP